MNIIRENYISQLKANLGNRRIKVLSGAKMSGKTYLFKRFMEFLAGNYDGNIVYVDFEDYPSSDDPEKTKEDILSRIEHEKRNFFFLDEVQAAQDYPQLLKTLYLDGRVDIFVASSVNLIELLGKEFHDICVGIYLYPPSFKEYIDSSDSDGVIRRKFSDYLHLGSSAVFAERDNGRKVEIDYDSVLKNVFEDFADLISSEPSLPEKITRFIFENTGVLTAPRKISSALSLGDDGVYPRIVDRYISYLNNHFLVYRAPRYDVKRKQFPGNLEKYYFADMGLKNSLLGDDFVVDMRCVLQNIVYLELLRRGYEVFVGKINFVEVSFAARKNDRFSYYQVVESITDKISLLRETTPLQKIEDDGQKLVLTLDANPIPEYEGVKCMNLIKWLLSDA